MQMSIERYIIAISTNRTLNCLYTKALLYLSDTDYYWSVVRGVCLPPVVIDGLILVGLVVQEHHVYTTIGKLFIRPKHYLLVIEYRDGVILTGEPEYEESQGQDWPHLPVVGAWNNCHHKGCNKHPYQNLLARTFVDHLSIIILI